MSLYNEIALLNEITRFAHLMKSFYLMIPLCLMIKFAVLIYRHKYILHIVLTLHIHSAIMLTKGEINMAKSSSMTIRINPKLKTEADNILNYLGLTTSEAVSIFLRQVVLKKGIPFEITALQFNNETLIAMQEAKEIANINKGFENIDDMFRELKS